ncbi:MAG TPA: methyltransferase domain-containing protein [Acidobacteriota bacterium]|nr:methyltransferase domain-containing protein [Acidobacteriota bacterium]
MRLYSELAPWWPLVSPPEEYVEDAAFYRQCLISHCNPAPESLLELGSGGGNNASYLKAHFRMTLVDLSEQMLTVSRALNPDCEHLQGDMRSVRLGRVFDAVFIHDAIVYMATTDDLRRAIDTAFQHCRPGGVALFVPDFTRETFRPSTDHGGCDGARGSLRYLEWSVDPDPQDNQYTVYYAIILRENGQPVRYYHDEHLEGLFSRDEWTRLLADVGFDPKLIRDPESRDLFLGKRP